MSPAFWLQIVAILAGTLVAISQAAYWWGRWTKGVDGGATLSPIQRLSVDMENLTTEVKRLREEMVAHRQALTNQYVELATRVNTDHLALREVLTWKAGLLSDLTTHFYPSTMIDQILNQIRDDLAAHKAIPMHAGSAASEVVRLLDGRVRHLEERVRG